MQRLEASTFATAEMSALGHKRTCAAHKPMSALHPIADMCGATSDVRFVPIADITKMFSCLNERSAN